MSNCLWPNLIEFHKLSPKKISAFKGIFQNEWTPTLIIGFQERCGWENPPLAVYFKFLGCHEPLKARELVTTDGFLLSKWPGKEQVRSQSKGISGKLWWNCSFDFLNQIKQQERRNPRLFPRNIPILSQMRSKPFYRLIFVIVAGSMSSTTNDSLYDRFLWFFNLWMPQSMISNLVYRRFQTPCIVNDPNNYYYQFTEQPLNSLSMAHQVWGIHKFSQLTHTSNQPEIELIWILHKATNHEHWNLSQTLEKMAC